MSSYYPLRTRPAVGPDAFSRVDPETAPSQAAVLLLIGRQLRGDDDALLERARKVRRGTRVQMSALEADDEPTSDVRSLIARARALGQLTIH